MGVSLLTGTADGTNQGAALYCNTTGEMLGTIWEGDGAIEAAEGFLDWIGTLRFINAAEEIGLDSIDLPKPGDDGNDPRQWPLHGLKKLETFYRRNFVDEHGYVSVPIEDGEVA